MNLLVIGGKRKEVWNESLKNADTVITSCSVTMAVGIIMMFHHSQSVPSRHSMCLLGMVLYVSIRYSMYLPITVCI